MRYHTVQFVVIAQEAWTEPALISYASLLFIPSEFAFCFTGEFASIAVGRNNMR